MDKINAKITGIGAFVPEYILTNEELSQMVDTSDEWIMTRIGIKERHILKGEGKGASEMGVKAVENLFQKTGLKPEDVDLLICSTVTPDRTFPATANIICDKANIRDAFSFDVNAGCSGFLYILEIATQYIQTGKYKKIVLVSAEKMSSITDYTDRQTCAIFGDAATAVLLEPTLDDEGVLDSSLHADGFGRKYLNMKAGGSEFPATKESVEAREHYIYQEGRTVFKHAVEKMSQVAVDIMDRNNLKSEDIAWLVPHQANMRIISATGNRMGLPDERVMVNIQKYGNTTSASIPLCLWENEAKFKKGDKIVLAAFGAGFTWGASYVKWAYDTNN